MPPMVRVVENGRLREATETFVSWTKSRDLERAEC